MPHDESEPARPRFEPGARVRVRSGVTAPGAEDIPLGGWTGTVKRSEPAQDQIHDEVEWDRRTLDAMPPVYRERCERAGLPTETVWLAEADLEPDDGTPMLSEKDRDDRVRRALGLAHDDPIPGVSLETLLAYHRYLAANLKFPLFATYWETAGPYSRRKMAVTVTGLLSPEGDDLGEGGGLRCRGLDRTEQVELPLAGIELGPDDPGRRLLADYVDWLRDRR